MSNNSARLLPRLLAFLLALLLSSTVNTAIYKWVDDKGRVHYSDEDPEEYDAKNIEGELPGNFYDGSLVDYGAIRSRKRENPQIIISITTYKYRLTKRDRREIKQVINKIYDVYEGMFGWPDAQAFPINVKVWGQKAEYNRAQKKIAGSWVSSSGYFSPANNIAAVMAGKDKKATIRVIYHEASHAIFHARAKHSMPNWINEGLAEYFEPSFIRKSHLMIGMPRYKQRALSRMLDNDNLSSLTRFFAIPNRKWRTASNRVQSDYYTLAWSIVSYMMTSEMRQKILAGLISEADKSPQSFSAKEYISSHYRDGFSQFARRWRAWVNEFVKA